MATPIVIATAALVTTGTAALAVSTEASASDAPVEDSLPELVITATRIERDIFDTPRAVTVLDRQAIEAANVSSTPDLFRYAEGVYLQKTNQGGGSPFISGLTGTQVLILIDGVRLNNSYFRFGPHQYLNTIDPSTIERIEVVRGPTSVLYGSDALGGTINVITRRRTDFARESDLDTRLQARTHSAADATEFGLQMEGNVGTFGLIGGGSVKDYGEVDGGGRIGEQVPSAYEERNADLKLNWRLSEHSELIFGNQYVRQYDVPKTSEVTLGDKLQFDYEPQERLLSYLELRSREIGPFDAMTLNVSHHRQREGEEIVARATPPIAMTFCFRRPAARKTWAYLTTWRIPGVLASSSACRNAGPDCTGSSSTASSKPRSKTASSSTARTIRSSRMTRWRRRSWARTCCRSAPDRAYRASPSIKPMWASNSHSMTASASAPTWSRARASTCAATRSTCPTRPIHTPFSICGASIESALR